MSMQKLRIAIFANGERGLKVIKELIAKEYEIKAVVYPPNKKIFSSKIISSLKYFLKTILIRLIL